MNAIECSCGQRTVVDPDYPPAHCPRCKKSFANQGEQWDSPFSDMTEGGAEYDHDASVFGGRFKP
jgi:threonine dehydrogenase-like Zn-dependent dehydrogenase